MANMYDPSSRGPGKSRLRCFHTFPGRGVICNGVRVCSCMLHWHGIQERMVSSTISNYGNQTFVRIRRLVVDILACLIWAISNALCWSDAGSIRQICRNIMFLSAFVDNSALSLTHAAGRGPSPGTSFQSLYSWQLDIEAGQRQSQL